MFSRRMLPEVIIIGFCARIHFDLSTHFWNMGCGSLNKTRIKLQHSAPVRGTRGGKGPFQYPIHGIDLTNALDTDLVGFVQLKPYILGDQSLGIVWTSRVEAGTYVLGIETSYKWLYPCSNIGHKLYHGLRRRENARGAVYWTLTVPSFGRYVTRQRELF